MLAMDALGGNRIGMVDSIAYFLMMIDPCLHGKADPFSADIGDYICPITAVFAGGECGAAESVASVSEIRTKAKNWAC
jgi:hypothetical protein